MLRQCLRAVRSSVSVPIMLQAAKGERMSAINSQYVFLLIFNHVLHVHTLQAAMLEAAKEEEMRMSAMASVTKASTSSGGTGLLAKLRGK